MPLYKMTEACVRILEQRLAGDASPLLFEKVIYRAHCRESVDFPPGSPRPSISTLMDAEAFRV